MLVTKTTVYKSKHFWWLVLKLVIIVVLAKYIYDTLTSNEELSFQDFLQTLKDPSVFSPIVFISLFAFTIGNWSAEIVKWKILANTIQPISFGKATAQSLASLTFSLITPNRIGEYGAKALYFPKQKRKNILILNFIGNFHQMLVTFILGTFGLFFLGLNLDYFFSAKALNLIRWIPIIVGIVILILSFNKRIVGWIKKQLQQANFITRKLNFLVFNISLIRYLIFSHQFYFLLVILNADISYEMAMLSISSMYLIASVIPMISLVDFVLKGSVAITIFSLLNVSPLIILTVTTLMWLFDFAVPAFFGSYFVMTFKPLKS